MEAARQRLSAIKTKPDLDERSAHFCRGIKKVSDREVARLYRLGEQVMESTNTGIEVLRAVRLSDKLRCVVKTRARPESFKTPHLEREWRRTTEVQLSMPETARLCQYYEVFETETKYYVVMEKVEGEDLFEVLGKGRLSIADAREIVKQMLEALAILHGQGRIHKDLKIENVMVAMTPPSAHAARPVGDLAASGRLSNSVGSGGSPASAKLIDFDTMEDWEPSSPKAKEVLGTDGYIAPEAYLGEYSPASDIYAAGVVMYKILVGDFPTRDDIFDDRPGENWVGSPQMKKIHERLKSEVVDFTCPPFDADSAAAVLCASLLKFDPADRPSASEALQHEWFYVAEQ
eukprot:CAMPEP_0198509304 /NCGR_PEP_ID=MMETSP1462-20131121/13482_1 /TAXON_ID=1333877 /ORGANISM="Brandtodinium nutriculum, Strain RCC3387" /LENGTH=345 /DNA_ID=CAMNT_0044238605 /DNA_START=42 /DNA_END=1079 /DNA_ORIENTATION=+